MSTPASPVEHLDVLVVGAGLSGLGVGRYLRTLQPHRTFAILEARSASGGTWDLFRYPGVRSDSDPHTLGYAYAPWHEASEASVASAAQVLRYLRETATRNDLDRRIRFHHQVTSADWSSTEASWRVQVVRLDREVVVVGSGSTAVTLVPALADLGARVTMLQRTPTYVLPVPTRDVVAGLLRRLLGRRRGYAWTRRKNIARQRALWVFCRRFPGAARRLIRRANRRRLPPGYPVGEHFDPPYGPWDQRLCAVPDGDLFTAIRSGRARVVTDRIATFTETGLLLQSGIELAADLVVTATGLHLRLLGGMVLRVDGRTVSLPDTVVYRGLMLSGVPNFAVAMGYPNASWTLRVDLVCEYFCRLLGHLAESDHDVAVAVPDPDMPTRPMLDLTAGYVQRAVDELPRQGPRAPWSTSTSYRQDRRLRRRGPVVDRYLHLTQRGATLPAPGTGT